MHGIAVTLLTEDKERVSVLQHRLEATNMGRNVFTHVGFPASAIDPVVRQIQDVRTECGKRNYVQHHPSALRGLGPRRNERLIAAKLERHPPHLHPQQPVARSFGLNGVLAA